MKHNETTWELALIDLDGTLFRGNDLIPGAPEFVQRVRRRGIRPVFFTNNATRTPEHVCTKLNTLGIAGAPEEVCTSAQAAADWLLRTHGPTATVVYIGTDGIHGALADANLVAYHARQLTEHNLDDTAFDAAVMGLDPNVNYTELTSFCQVVSEIGGFVLTNADVRLPVGDKFAPGNGALGSFVSTATGFVPVVIGKPAPGFVQYALTRYGASANRTVLIGDNVLTDVQAGVNAGVYTLQVKTGVDIPSDIQADEVWSSVSDLFK